MSRLITENESIIWASKHYLKEPLPKYYKYNEWKEKDLEEYIRAFVCKPFDHHQPCEVWEYIENLALDFRNTFNEKLNKVNQ